MLRIIDRTQNRTMAVDGVVFTVKPMSVRDRMVLSTRISKVQDAGTPLEQVDGLIDIMAEQIVSIEGATSSVKETISDFESWRDIIKVAQALMSEAGLTEPEAKNSDSSPAS